MTAAAALAHETGIAVLTREQTAGRGQYGRSWHCPPGAGVLLAVVLNPPPAVRRPAVLTAWAAVGVADCVARLTGFKPRIKWPNDVLVVGKKICGILIESAAGASAATVAGIGLNVTQSAADFVAVGLPDATSLAACSHGTFDTDDVARKLLTELDRAYRLLIDDLPTLEANWGARLGLSGREVDVETTDGSLRRGWLHAVAFAGLTLEIGNAQVTMAPETVRHVIAVDRDRA
jgi:BirA family biotin operon repressor/biotin-[acetyl-CoA-carboxylase] ligase